MKASFAFNAKHNSCTWRGDQIGLVGRSFGEGYLPFAVTYLGHSNKREKERVGRELAVEKLRDFAYKYQPICMHFLFTKNTSLCWNYIKLQARIQELIYK